MQVEDLPCLCLLRGPALDAEELSAAPGHLHHPLGCGSRAQGLEEGLDDRCVFHGTKSRMDEKTQTGPAALRLFLDQLEIGRPAADPGRKLLLEGADHVCIEKGHSLGGELLE